MTTIAYCHRTGKIACDGRVTKNNSIRSETYHKWCNTPHGIAFFCGTVSDINLFIKYMGEDCRKLPISSNVECLLVRDGKVFECAFDDNDGYYEIELTFSSSLGSGAPYADSALKYGESAENAVKHAHDLDIGTGGVVFVYDIKTGKFL